LEKENAQLTSRTLARTIADLALSKKAADVTIMDLKKLETVADFFVICSGDSDTQVKAIANAIQEGTAERGMNPWHMEGLRARTWVVLDYVDVVVHVFHTEARSFYRLERLWADAKMTVVGDRAGRTGLAPKARTRKKTSRMPAARVGANRANVG
jgi:ribosome-associated protein